MDNFSDNFSVLLASLLDKKGVTQKKLAMETGMSVSTISKIVSGIRKDVSIVEVAKISKALNVPASVFCEGIACDSVSLDAVKQKTLFGAKSVVEKVYENSYIGTLIFISYFFDRVIVKDPRRFIFNNSTEHLHLFLRVEKGALVLNGKTYDKGAIINIDQNSPVNEIDFYSGAIVQSTCFGKYEPFWKKFKKDYIIAYKES